MITRGLHFLLLAAICAGGVWLQWHEHFELSSYRNPWAFLGTLFPYALCAIVALRSESVVPAIAGALFALGVDSIAHYDVFVRPTGMSALLAFLFVPLFSTLVFVPITILLTRAFLRRRDAKRAAREEAAEQRPRKLEPRLR